MAREERAELDPLDVPLSRKDVLELLHELGRRRTVAGPAPSAISDGEVSTMLIAIHLANHFRVKWSKPPVPEKFVPPDVSEARDG